MRPLTACAPALTVALEDRTGDALVQRHRREEDAVPTPPQPFFGSQAKPSRLGFSHTIFEPQLTCIEGGLKRFQAPF